jgi:hypothetical protein
MKSTCRILAAVALCAAAGASFAQSSVRITPYLWGAGFDGTVGSSGTSVGLGDRIEANTEDLTDNLRMGGVMLHGAWRNGRMVAFGDWTYADVKADSPTRFATLYSGVDVKIKGHVLEGYVGYELTGSRDTHVDVFAGARYYNLDLELGLREGTRPGVLVGSDRDWVDGVVGIRFDTLFATHWEAFASADVGGGGSDLSWQLFGGVGYRFAWGSVLGGWRHLHVDIDKSDFRLDGALSGPFLGVSLQF